MRIDIAVHYKFPPDTDSLNTKSNEYPHNALKTKHQSSIPSYWEYDSRKYGYLIIF